MPLYLQACTSHLVVFLFNGLLDSKCESHKLSYSQVLQQLHNTESCQLKSDILGLRKELKAAKSAPASLEKERDGLRKDLEKVKTKLGDIEAKLKTTLIEKSKVEVCGLLSFGCAM